MDGTHKGKILWFNAVKGYGEIVANEGQRFFFIESAASRPISAGARVAFQTSDRLLFGKPQVHSIKSLDAAEGSSVKRKPKIPEAEV